MNPSFTPKAVPEGHPPILARKKSLLFWKNIVATFVIMLLGMAPFKSKAVTVTIGTSSYSYTSVYGGLYINNKYSSSENVYTSAEVGIIGNITSFAMNVGYQSGTPTSIDSVTVYMKEVSASTPGSAVDLSTYTQVWKGDFPNSSTGWQTVTLGTSFAYSGAGNLSIVTVRRNGTASSSYTYYWYSTNSSSKVAYYYSGSDYISGYPGTFTHSYSSTGVRSDVRMNIDAFAACTGTPASGTAIASTTTACPGDAVKFSLSGATMASSITYQWDTSSTGTGGWALAGTSTTTPGTWSFIPPGGRTLYYRCRSTCSAGGSTVTSTSVSVSVGSALLPPYSETFEGVTAGNNPPCATASPKFSSGVTYYYGYDYWKVINDASSIYAASNHTPGGSNYLVASLYIGSGVGYGVAADYWFTPGISLSSGKTYRFSYWHRMGTYAASSYGGGVDHGMYYASSPSSSATLTAIKPDKLSCSNSSYEQNAGDFSVPSSGVYFLAIKANNKNFGGYYCAASFDDIGLVELPACNTVTSLGSGGKAAASPNVICSTPGTTTLSLSSTPAYSGLEFSWESAVGTPTTFSATGLTTMSASRSIISGGTYYFRCKITCTASGLTTYSDTVKVTTAPITPPYVEDFEGASPGTNLPCAGYTYSWSSGIYWNIAGAPYASYAPGILNHTTGGSKYLHAGYYLGTGSGNAEYWFTPGLALTAAKAYNVSFWFSNSGYYPSSYASQATELGVAAGTSQTSSAMTLAAGLDTVININAVSTPTYNKLTRGFIAPTTGTYYVGIKVNHKDYCYYGFAIDDIGIDQVPPCSAKPSAGTAVATPAMICSSGSTKLSLKGTSVASDLSFQWYESNASGALVTLIPGATGLTYTTPTISAGPVYYRCLVTCTVISAPNTDTSTILKINVGPITPPYIETFESATPGVNQPCASNTYLWDAGSGTSYFYYWGIKSGTATGYYSSSITNHTPGGTKYLSSGYYVGGYTGAVDGNKQYWFSPPLQLTGGGMAYKCNYWYVTNTYSYSPGNAMTVGLYYGTAQSDAAMLPIRDDMSGETNTEYKQIEGTLRPPASGVYYLGLKVNHAYGYYGGAIDDIGVEQLPLCSGKPAAGKVASLPSRICSSGSATLSLSGTTAASMLSFDWYESTTGTGGWSLVGSGVTYTTASLTASRYYRAVVKCGLVASPNTDTTPIFKLNVGPLDPPYIEDFEAVTAGTNVACASNTSSWGSDSYWTTKTSPWSGGYFTLENHTTAGKGFLLAGYYLGIVTGSPEYWFSPGINLRKDSTYQFSYWYLGAAYPYSPVTTTLGMYYGTAQTRAGMTTAIAPDLTGVNTATYKQYLGRFVAPTTNVYYFGVKVQHTTYAYYGVSIDDIGIEQLAPCTGKAVAGTISVSPTMLCSSGGTAFMNMDMATTSKSSGLIYSWESASDPAFTTGLTVSTPSTSPNYTSAALTATRWFRCIVTCKYTGDTTRSAVSKVDVGVITPPYIETFEMVTPGTNAPCASYTYGFGSESYWNTYGSPRYYYYPAADNHTPGGSRYLNAGYYIGAVAGAAQYWFTPAIKFVGGQLYQFNCWYTTSGSTTSPTSFGVYYGASQSAAAMTTSIVPDFNTIKPGYLELKKLFTPATSGNFYLGFKVYHTYDYYGFSIDDIGLQAVPPCSDPVAAGTPKASPSHICSSGGSTVLELLGTTLATGLNVDWYSASSPAGPYTLAGTGVLYNTDPLTANTWFRSVVTCTASGIKDTSAAIKIGVGGLDLPYTEDFESTAVMGRPICSEATYWGIDYYDGLSIQKSNINDASQKNHTPGGKNFLLSGYYLGAYSYYTPMTEDNFWFTPGLNLDNRYKYAFGFWYQGNSGYNFRIGAYYGKSQTVGAMTNKLMTFQSFKSGSYKQFDTTFKPATSGIYYVGLKVTSSALGSWSYYGVAFDDINLNYAPCDGMPFTGSIISSFASGTPLCINTNVKLVDTGATLNLVPGIKYQWMRRSLSTAGSWKAVAGATDTILTADTLIGYEYKFAVVCGNTNDTAFSPLFQLPALPKHPDVNITPSTSPIIYCLGDTVKFNATGFTSGIYDWMSDSVVIPGWKFSDMGATEPGIYMVKVSSPLSPCPAYSNKVKLIVNDPGYTVNLTTPTDSIVCFGSSILLSATSSKPGVTYQWRKDNVSISGATGSTYLANTTGYYRVVASDGVSSCAAASRNIKITVKANPPAVLSVPEGTTTACENEGVLLNANRGSYSYEWLRGGSTIAGWNDSSYVIKVSGVYSVKVRTADGCVSMSTPVTVNILPSPLPVIVKTVTGSSVILSTGTYIGYQWMRNGVDIPGAVASTLPLTLNGIYKVRVWGTNNCEGVSAPMEIAESGLSINSASIKTDQIRIYPNPTQSKVYIESPVTVKVAVKDAAGKEVLRATETKEVDLSKFADGVYLFTISDAAGNELIKQQRVTKFTNK